jgi:hypothetical protein
MCTRAGKEKTATIHLVCGSPRTYQKSPASPAPRPMHTQHTVYSSTTRQSKQHLQLHHHGSAAPHLRETNNAFRQ